MTSVRGRAGPSAEVGAEEVEDAPAGVEAARAAGMACVAVASTHAAGELGGAEIVIGSLEELPAVLADRFDASSVLRA